MNNIKFIFIARALGFEPRSKVLETRMLPLHHARKKKFFSTKYKVLRRFAQVLCIS